VCNSTWRLTPLACAASLQQLGKPCRKLPSINAGVAAGAGAGPHGATAFRIDKPYPATLSEELAALSPASRPVPRSRLVWSSTLASPKQLGELLSTPWGWSAKKSRKTKTGLEHRPAAVLEKNSRPDHLVVPLVLSTRT